MSRRRFQKRAATRVIREAQFRYLLILLGLAAICILLLLYFHFRIGSRDPIWANIVAGLVTPIVIFIILYVVFGLPGIQLSRMPPESSATPVTAFFPRHDDVPWAAIIDRARTIDIVVFYYGRWVRDFSEQFAAFFGRGGALRIIMSDPDDESTLRVVHDHFFPNLTFHKLRENIHETETVLRDLYTTSAAPRAALDVYYYPTALHYSIVLVDNHELYLSVYEQFRGHFIRSSVFQMDLRRNAQLEEYWHSNVNEFIRRSRKG